MPTFAQRPNVTQQTAPSGSAVAGRTPLGQSFEVDADLQLQRTFGNQAVLRMLRAHNAGSNALSATESPRFRPDRTRTPIPLSAPAVMQTKLAMNQPGDEYEQEADHVAEQVMRMPEPQLQRKCACGGTCADCQKERSTRDEGPLQRKSVSATGPAQTEAPPVVHQVLRSPGLPLDAPTRVFMEPRFGFDFSRVRVHSGTAAGQSAREVNAEAYTVGHNVVFAAGKFAPGTNDGRRLLAHELAHVVQQSAVEPARMGRPRIAAPDNKPEREAEQTAKDVLSGDSDPVGHRTSQAIVQRLMCRDILNAEEVPAVTRGKEVERQVRVDMISQLGGQFVLPLAIPDASARLTRMEECGGFQTTQPPGFGFPDLAFINGRNIELAEVKIGTWPCLFLAEQQVDKYVDMANKNDAFKRSLGVDTFELMPTSRFTPSQLRAADGTRVDVGWCSPGVIVYKAVTRSTRDTLVCGISDKGRTDAFLDLLFDQAVDLAARAIRRRLEGLGLGPVNLRLLIVEVRKRIQEQIRWYLKEIIDTLCATAKAVSLAAVLAELKRLLSLQNVAEGFLERFSRPGEGIDIPVAKLALETSFGLAILGALAEVGVLVLSL